MWKLLLLLAIFILIQTQNATQDEVKDDAKKIEEQLKENMGAKTQERMEQPRRPSPYDFSISLDEMDRILACSYLLSFNVEENQQKINETAIKFNKTFNDVATKISYNRLHKCAGEITKEEANLFFKDLDFRGTPKEAKKMSKFVDVDFSEFNESSSFALTTDETFTAFKYEKARAKYDENRTDKYKKNKDKIWFLEYFENYPLFKSLFFLIVIFIFTFGMIYLLNKVTKKPKVKKNKKKNN